MTEFVVGSWRQFQDVINHLDVGSVWRQTYVFRGHSDASWELKRSLLRMLPQEIKEVEALEIEKNAQRKFRERAHAFIDASLMAATLDVISWWALMQHHGAPTRLLDWTSSPYVATYFAVMEKHDINGAIWVIHENTLATRQSIDDGYSDFPKTMLEQDRLLLQPDSPHHTYFVERPSKTERLIVQQGCFSVCRSIVGDHGKVFSKFIPENGDRELFGKIIIPAALKPDLFRKLRAVNITASSLFPGLDGLGRSIAELIRLEVASSLNP